MNSLTIIGNITRDPEVRTTKTGKDVKRCEILHAIEGVLHYESDEAERPKDGRCELAGCSTILKEEQ